MLASRTRAASAHGWRRIAAGTAAWPVAMTVSFLGATAPGTTWPVWSVLVLGTVTGVVAGGLQGVVPGWFLPSLTGATGVDRTGWYWRPAPRAADRGPSGSWSASCAARGAGAA